MKMNLLPFILAMGLAAGPLFGQDATPPAGAPPPAVSVKGRGFHLLPPGAVERLNLTVDQYAQVKALEADVQAKLEKILTPQQLQQLDMMGRGGRRGGRGGPGGQGGPGGPGGGNPPPPPQQQ